jgi:hypothetical protein
MGRSNAVLTPFCSTTSRGTFSEARGRTPATGICARSRHRGVPRPRRRTMNVRAAQLRRLIERRPKSLPMAVGEKPVWSSDFAVVPFLQSLLAKRAKTAPTTVKTMIRDYVHPRARVHGLAADALLGWFSVELRDPKRVRACTCRRDRHPHRTQRVGPSGRFAPSSLFRQANRCVRRGQWPS